MKHEYPELRQWLTQIGNRIIEIRKRLDISQKEMAAALEIGQTSLLSYEKGKGNPNLLFCLKLIEKYNVNPRYLFLGDEELFLKPSRNPAAMAHSDGRSIQDIATVQLNFIDSEEDMLWFMRQSTLFKHYMMGFATKFQMENKHLIEQNIKSLRERGSED